MHRTAARVGRVIRYGRGAYTPAHHPASAATAPACRLTGKLRERIDSALSPLLERVREVALLDFPSYPNVGDSAIWLGTRRWLRDAGIGVRYVADIHTFSEPLLRSRLPEGVILLQGGGNFGDLWQAPQLFRERVIDRFREHRIIVLPQTIWFREAGALERARRIFDAHPDLTLLLRDHASVERARQSFRCPVRLCPDLAFALGPLDRPAGRPSGCVRLLRTDVEARADRAALDLPAGFTADWTDRPTGLHERAVTGLRAALADRPRGYPVSWRTMGGLGEIAARLRLRYGVQLLSRGETVVTDRLHGHILSLLLGIPHVLIDNGYGKIGEFHRTWTRGSPLVTEFISRAPRAAPVAASRS